MLIQFSIKNFKAFKDKAILSLVASNYDKERELENLVNFKECDVKILKFCNQFFKTRTKR